MRNIEPAGPAHQIGDDDRKDGAENPGADPVERLHRDQPERVVGKRVEAAAQRQNEKGGKEQRLPPPAVGARSDQHRHRHHHHLRRDNAGRHQARAEVLVLQRQFLADQWQHCRIRQMKQHHGNGKDQERPAGEEYAQSAWRVVSARPGTLAFRLVVQPAG